MSRLHELVGVCVSLGADLTSLVEKVCSSCHFGSSHRCVASRLAGGSISFPTHPWFLPTKCKESVFAGTGDGCVPS